MRGFIGTAILAALLFAIPIYAQQNSPQPIAYGQTVTGELDTQNIESLYIFAGQQGDAITVTMDTIDGALDPLLILVDQSEQSVLAIDNDSGGDRNARLRYVIPAASNYIIRATTMHGTGNIQGTYRLALTLNNPPPTPSPHADTPLITPFLSGEVYHGDLNDSTRFHLYSLRAQQGDPISATVQADNELQIGLYLYASDFHEITRAERGGDLTLKAPADGLYFLMVARDATSGTGSYTLRQGTANDAVGLALSPGKTLLGSITADAPVKTYHLQGVSGQTLVVRMRRLSGDLNPALSILATDGSTLLAQANAADKTAELTLTFPADGTYSVVATREGQQNGTTTGSYLLIAAPPGDLPALPANFEKYTRIDYGDKTTGTLDKTVYAAPYVFAAEPGDTVQAVMTSTDPLDSYLILQNANGDTVAEDDNSAGQSNAQLHMTIPQAGYYALIATRAGFANGSTTGSFTLSLNILDPAQPADLKTTGTALIAGQPLTSSIGAQIGGVFRFEAQDNMAVDLEVSTAGGLDVVTILADSDFREVARSLAGPVRTVLLPHAGTYYVVVVQSAGPIIPASGNYTLTLHGTINPAPTLAPVVLTSGQTVNGTINKEIYQVRYFVNVHQGMVLAVTMAAAPGSTLDPMVSLLDSNNNLLAVNDDSAPGIKNAAFAYSSPQDGQYVVVATRSQEAAGTTTGDYTLKVEEQQPVAATPQLVTIRYGDTVNGAIGAQNFLLYYTFQGTEGDVVSIRMRHVPGATLDPVLYLYTFGSEPQLLMSNNDVEAGSPDAAIVDFKLPHSGLYLIAATRLDAAKGHTEGSFILTLSKQ